MNEMLTSTNEQKLPNRHSQNPRANITFVCHVRCHVDIGSYRKNARGPRKRLAQVKAVKPEHVSPAVVCQKNENKVV